jgi:hypothetical protein
MGLRNAAMRVPRDRVFCTARKQNDDEKYRFDRIDSDADNDFRTGTGRAERVVPARSD